MSGLVSLSSLVSTSLCVMTAPSGVRALRFSRMGLLANEPMAALSPTMRSADLMLTHQR